MHRTDLQQTIPPTGAQLLRHRYDPTTLAMDALAAAGHLVRGISPGAFDPIRAALAEAHAPLVRGAAGNVQIIAARITGVLEQTLKQAEQQVRAEQAGLQDL